MSVGFTLSLGINYWFCKNIVIPREFLKRPIKIQHLKIQTIAMGVADNFHPGKIYNCTRQQFIINKVLVCLVRVLTLSKMNYIFITMTKEFMTQLNVFILKLELVGPVNNRPSTDNIHHFLNSLRFKCFFLAAPSSSRSLVFRQSVGWLDGFVKK